MAGISLPVDWVEVRRASEQGVSDDELEVRFGISKNAIKQRRFREKWLTPAKVQEAAAIAAIKAKTSTMNVTAVTGPSALAVTADSLLQNGEQGSLLASNLALSLLQAAHANPNSLKPLADIYDLTAGMKAVRMAAGMDRQDSQTVNVSIGGWQASVTAQGPVAGFREVGPDSQECESEPLEDSQE